METDTEILFHKLADQGKAITNAREYHLLKYEWPIDGKAAETWIRHLYEMQQKIEILKQKINP